MRGRVAVLDYGSGNVRSVVRAVERVGVDVELTADPSVVRDADGLIVPGVGAFAACMAALHEVGGVELIRRRLDRDQPVLGICVGMQIMFAEGIEHGEHTVGASLWPGTVERLKAPIVPHMGWNSVCPPASSAMFEGLAAKRFYFVHSYGVRRFELAESDHGRPEHIHWAHLAQSRLAQTHLTWTEHGSDRFVAAVEHGRLWATQFHPEKSGDAGHRLLRNWVATF